MLYQDALLQRLEAGVRAALPRWGLQPSAEVSLLTISENATYLAEDAASGRRLVLRVHRPGYHNGEEISSELAWITELRAGAVVETPSPVPARDGALLSSFDDEGTVRYLVAFEHMSGKEPDPCDDLARWYGKLGTINARLHVHSRQWKKPEGFVRKVWDLDTILGPHAYWGDWRAGLGLDAQGRTLLERTIRSLGEQIGRYGSSPENFGLIHADMRPANLLVDGERLGVIDFDDCGWSWFAFDFAASISFLEHEPFVPDLMAAWADGYRSAAPLSQQDEAVLPIFVMLRRIHLTAWIASHAETPTAQSMGVPYTRGTIALADRYLTRYS